MKKLLILFDGPHLAYSPTTTQLYDELSKTFVVSIIAQNPNNYTGQVINNRRVYYHEYFGVKNRIFYKLYFEVLLFFSQKVRLFKKAKLDYRDYFFKFKFFENHIKTNNYDRVICIDITNLFFCSILKVKVDFLSLELTKNEHLLNFINNRYIECILIQSIERLNYLFNKPNFKTFLIQNAPIFKKIDIQLNERKHLIYSGSTIEALGFFHCLDYLNLYKDEVMTVQGAFKENDKIKVHEKYSNLLTENRLIINTEYLENDEVVDFISNYEIGFCFYDFENEFIKENYFNYFSAPSGKMFKYLAAGVPVVCSNILGFNFVKEFSCGEFVNSLKPSDIREAIIKIRKNYPNYSANAITAAKHFSFDNALKPYLEFIN